MDTDHTPNPAALTRKLALLAAVAAVTVGAMVLVGWAFDIGVLKSILPGWVSMKANAAVCFILTGIALWQSIAECGLRNAECGKQEAEVCNLKSKICNRINPQSEIRIPQSNQSAILLARLCGGLAGLIGLLTLGEYVFGWNLGIDQWLFRELADTVGTSHPGRMAPETALCFVLLAAALGITGGLRKTCCTILASVNLGLLVMTLALAALLSYATPGLGPYGWFGLTIMALHTALLFALLGMAVIAISWQPDVLQWSLGRNTTVAFACGMALLVFIGLNTSRSQFWLNEMNRRIAYSEEVLNNVVSLQAELVEAQTHTRGYIITGDTWFMAAYLENMSAYNRKMDALRPLIAGIPHQQQQISLIETKADLLRRWSQQFIDAPRTAISDADRTKIGAHAGDMLDNLRSTFNQIENEHQQLIKELKQEAESVTRLAYLSIASGTFASMIIFLAVIFRLNFAVNERKQSEAEFQRFFDLTPDLACIASADDGRFLKINAAWQKALGYTRQEILAQPFIDLIHPDDKAATLKEVERQLAGKATLQFNNRYLCKDGNYRWLEWKATPAVDHKLLFASARDITERKQVDDKLVASEQHFRAVTETANDAIITSSGFGADAGNVVGWNAAAERLFGYSKAGIIGQPLTKLMPERFHSQHSAGMARVVAGGAPHVVGQTVELVGLRKDGSEFPLELSLAQWQAANGQFFTAIIRDITERKLVKEALLQSEADLRTLVEHSPIATIVDVGVDIDEKIMMMNRKFTELFGYTLEDVPDVLHWWPLAYPDEKYREEVKAEWIGKVEKAIQSHSDIEPMETTVSCKDGSKRHIRFSLSSIGNRNIITFEDLTARKRAEDALKGSEELYRTMVESSNDMIWALSPDGKFTFINQQAADAAGRSIEDWLGKTFEPLVLEEDLPRVLEIHGKVMSGEKVHYEVRGKKAGDGILTLSVNASPLYKDGQVSGTISFASDITERRQAEMRLRESADEIEDLYNNAPCGYHSLDKDGIVRQINNTELAWLGYTRDEVVGKRKYTDFLAPASILSFQEKFPLVKKQGFIHDFQYEIIRKDGTKMSGLANVTAIYDASGDYLSSRSTVFDFTDHRQMEIRLRESEEKFKAIFDNATDGILLADMKDKKLLFGNATSCRMLGYAAEEIGNLHVMDIHPANELPHVISEFEKQARGDKVVAENIPVMRKDGSVFYAEITSAHLNIGGKTYLVGFFRDISERKLMQEKLLFDENRLEKAQQIGKLGFLDWDLSSNEIELSDETLRMYGLDPARKKLGAEEIIKLVHPDDVEFASKSLNDAIEGKSRHDMEHRILRPDGQVVYVHASAEVFRDAGGKPLRVLGTHLDISEIKLAQLALHQLNEELETRVQERTRLLLDAQEELVRREKLAVLGQVAGSVGHELRNPLGVMNNAVYYLQAVLTDADETTREYLNIIKEEIAASERIVSDLLDAVRIKPPNPEAVDAGELINQALRKCAVPSCVTVKLAIPATLSPLRVDAQQIHQVLHNLISNGVEAMAEGGTLEISAIENKSDKTVTLSVKDSGSGMTPEQLRHLFQPLFTTKARGIGLGLVVVKNLTQANGGRVEVASEAGKGTLFTITLPSAVSQNQRV